MDEMIPSSGASCLLPPAGKTITAASGDGELCQGTDPHPEKPFRFARSTVRDVRLASRTRLFPAASMPPSLQRPPHRGAGAEPRRALSPVSCCKIVPYHGEACASPWRGGMTEHSRVIAALTLTAVTKPARSIPTTAAGGVPSKTARFVSTTACPVSTPDSL